jgi:nucleotide-binding universal stress UspA family protein
MTQIKTVPASVPQNESMRISNVLRRFTGAIHDVALLRIASNRVFPHGLSSMFKNILLPVDGSELSRKAVSAAIQFARTTGGRLTPYMCVDEYPYLISSGVGYEDRLAFQQKVEAAAHQEMSKIEAAAALAGVPCAAKVSAAETPYVGIIGMARKLGCDVIFMASHGRRGISSLLLGSETQKVLSHSDIPVLVFR